MLMIAFVYSILPVLRISILGTFIRDTGYLVHIHIFGFLIQLEELQIKKKIPQQKTTNH